MKHYDRIWANIDLDIFDENLENMAKTLTSDTKMIGVIKADGYGHGAVPIAHEMERKDYVSGFATATLEEAQILRRSGIKKDILILGYTFPQGFEEMIKENISAALFREDTLKEMEESAKRAGKAMKVHIAVDTGMSRIGIQPDETGIAFVKKAMETNGVEIEGIFTHFATADENDKSKTYAQLAVFQKFIRRLEEELGLSVPVKHCSNSAGMIELSEAHMDAVRAGVILYGLWPSSEVSRSRISLKPILSLYSRIVFVKELEAGREISYGGTYTTTKKTRVATIPVGYADGYPRQLSNKADVLICGKRAPILGRVCMDQFMVDVTDIPEAKEGSLVTLIGSDEDQTITMEELGEISGRFNYELACVLGKRIPRVYSKGGKVIHTKDYFEDYE